MKNLYSINLDNENNICGLCIGDVILDGYIEMSEEEYKTSLKYRKFNTKTREFSEPIPQEESIVVKTNKELEADIELLNQAITELSMIMASM